MTFEEWWNKIVQERTGGNTNALDQDVYLRMRDMARQGWDAALESVRDRSLPFRLTQTHTYAVLEVRPDTFGDIAHRLELAGYQDQFHKGGTEIDMHGIAIAEEVLRKPRP